MSFTEYPFEPRKRVLSIQSHTVKIISKSPSMTHICSYRFLVIVVKHTIQLKYNFNPILGNKAAVFPLQTLGYDVDILNTVQFSNHTGYPSWTGKKFTAEDVQELFDGLEKNELTDEYTHVLTGILCHIKKEVILICQQVTLVTMLFWKRLNLWFKS